MMAQQRSEPLVEEWHHADTHQNLSVEERNLLSGAKQVFSVLTDAAVLACTFPRPSVVVKYNQLYLGDDKCQSVFFKNDVTTRKLCFVLQDS